MDELVKAFIDELEAAPSNKKQEVRDRWAKRFEDAGYGSLVWVGETWAL